MTKHDSFKCCIGLSSNLKDNVIVHWLTNCINFRDYSSFDFLGLQKNCVLWTISSLLIVCFSSFKLLISEQNRCMLYCFCKVWSLWKMARLQFYYKKNLVWHSHNFFLPYITVEEYFIISTTYIFNLYFLYVVVDELPAFIIIVYNFLF